MAEEVNLKGGCEAEDVTEYDWVRHLSETARLIMHCRSAKAIGQVRARLFVILHQMIPTEKIFQVFYIVRN